MRSLLRRHARVCGGSFGVVVVLATFFVALCGATFAQAETAWLGLVTRQNPLGGAEVTDIYPDSPAARTHAIHPGDVVIGIDKKPIGKPADLADQVRKSKVGQTLALSLRNATGVRRELQVRLSGRPDQQSLERLANQMEEARQKLLIGQPAPAFSFEPLRDHKPAPLPGRTRASFLGKPLVLTFFATWCGPCLREIPQLTELQARYPQARVLALSVEPKDVIRTAIAQFSPGYLVGQDPGRGAYDSFFVGSYPTTFLIDAAGIVRGVDHGDLETIEPILETLFRSPHWRTLVTPQTYRLSPKQP